MTRALFTALLFVFALVGAAPSPRAAEADALVFETAAGPRIFTVEVAATSEQRSTGLMYRRSLAPDRGMLFDFGVAQPVAMWMENTYVALDMVFVRADGRVQRIESDTEPLSTRVIESGVPVRFVVELVAGTAKRIGLAAGDTVVHPRIAP